MSSWRHRILKEAFKFVQRREKSLTLVVCCLLPLKREKKRLTLAACFPVWRPLAFLPVALPMARVMRGVPCTCCLEAAAVCLHVGWRRPLAVAPHVSRGPPHTGLQVHVIPGRPPATLLQKPTTKCWNLHVNARDPESRRQSLRKNRRGGLTLSVFRT